MRIRRQATVRPTKRLLEEYGGSKQLIDIRPDSVMVNSWADDPIWADLEVIGLDGSAAVFDESDFERHDWFYASHLSDLGEPIDRYTGYSPGCGVCMSGRRRIEQWRFKKAVSPRRRMFNPAYHYDQIVVEETLFLDGVLTDVDGVEKRAVLGPRKAVIPGIVEMVVRNEYSVVQPSMNAPCERCGAISFEFPRLGPLPAPVETPKTDIWRISTPLCYPGRPDFRYPVVFHKRVISRLRSAGLKLELHPLSLSAEEPSS